jgi:hypothetical protein
MNTVWVVHSEDERYGGTVAVFTDRNKAQKYIDDNDEDGWWVLVSYNGDTGSYVGKQGKS